MQLKGKRVNVQGKDTKDRREVGWRERDKAVPCTLLIQMAREWYYQKLSGNDNCRDIFGHLHEHPCQRYEDFHYDYSNSGSRERNDKCPTST